MQLFLITLFGSAIALAGGGPHDRESPKPFMLSEALDKTLCPMRVTVNDNKERVPRLIKYITCEAQAPAPAAAEPHRCSHRVDARYSRSCVQLEDYAPVMYLQEDGTYMNSTVRVPVGCACMQFAGSSAAEIIS